MKQFVYIFSILFFFSFQDIFSQISEKTVPFSVTNQLRPVNEFVQMPLFDKSQLIDKDNNNRLKVIKRHYFAKMLDVDLSVDNSGKWETTPDGSVWRLGIRSQGAYSLYLIFNGFKLAPGVKLFVYNEGMANIAGAFTSKNNNDYDVLSVAPVPGEAVVIELDVPTGIEDFGKMTLVQVGHDYKNEFGKNKLKSSSGSSGTCEVDINCPQGAPWQTEKRAVCRIIVNGFYCTGTLINNAGPKILPYFITAQHCVKDQSDASTALFYFNYEEPNCGADISFQDMTMAGASLIASTDTKLDFALLKLNQFPPAVYEPYFVGWDNSINPPSSGVCIHHPEGDAKKISIDNQPLTTANFGDGYDTNSHWIVSRWSMGTTEGGSSGSPVFNSSHRLFGTLTGGLGSCASPDSDYFSKFSRAWADYPNPANQLKAWLDPDNLGVSYINGIDPYGFDAVGDTFSNVTKTETLGINRANLAWGWLSGHNSLGYTSFAEKFTTTDTWKVPGLFLDVAKAYYSITSTVASSTISIKVWQGSTSPVTQIYSQNINIQNLQPNAVNFIHFDSLLTFSGTIFIGYTINYIHTPISTSPLDTFAVYMAADRGASGYSGMYIYNGSWHNISNVTSPNIYTSLAISWPGYKGLNLSVKVPEIEQKLLKIYPNPCYDYAFVEFPYQTANITVECVDIMGRVLALPYEIYDQGIRLGLGNFHSGLYTLIIKSGQVYWTSRFIVEK